MGGRVAGVPGGALRGVARRAGELHRSRRALGAAATRETAKHSLQGSARALAEQRYSAAAQTVRDFEGAGAAATSAAAAKLSKGGRGTGKGDAERPLERAAGSGAVAEGGRGQRPADSIRSAGKSRGGASPTPERYRRAKELLSQVERNQARLGERWSGRDLRRFEAEDQELLENSRDPADHAHRAGYERTRFEALSGPERQRAEEEIERARKRDSKRQAVASMLPGRIRGRRRQGAERMRQATEEAGDFGSSGRYEQLRRLRRERRADPLTSRRNMSRGA
jgi:hypothetical protein